MAAPAGQLPATAPPSFLVVLGQAALRAGRCGRLAFPLYVPGVLLAVLATVPIAVGLIDASTLGPWTARAAEGDLLRVLAEAGLSSLPDAGQAITPPQVEQARAGASLSAGLTALSVLLNGLAYSVLAGGVLSRLLGDTSTSFWQACRRWVWPMLRFGVLAMLVFVILAAAGGAVVAVLPASDAVSASLKLVLLAGWLAWINGLLEFARAEMVARQDGRAWRALARALALPARPSLFLQAALAWAALALLGGIVWSIAAPLLLAVPATLLPAAFLLGQALALVGAWIKLLRLAVAVQLARAAGDSPFPQSATMESFLEDSPA